VQRIVQNVIGGQVDKGRDGARMARTDEWICVFDARVGGRAKAVFESRDGAIAFAEHHANSLTPAGTPLALKWEDTNAAAISTTQLGQYLIARQPTNAEAPRFSPVADYGRSRQVT
jgi:hypothetical protein